MTVKKPPPPVTYEDLIRELRNVATQYPLFRGHAVDARALAECARRRWIVQQADGGYLPTARGIRVLDGEVNA